MATYTFETTARREKLLDWLVRRANKGKANGEQITKQQFVEVNVFEAAFRDFQRQFEQHINMRVGEEFQRATAAKQASVLTALGVSPDAEE